MYWFYYRESSSVSLNSCLFSLYVISLPITVTAITEKIYRLCYEAVKKWLTTNSNYTCWTWCIMHIYLPPNLPNFIQICDVPVMFAYSQDKQSDNTGAILIFVYILDITVMPKRIHCAHNQQYSKLIIYWSH